MRFWFMDFLYSSAEARTSLKISAVPGSAVQRVLSALWGPLLPVRKVGFAQAVPPNYHGLIHPQG
jgi:hypothetical protein